MASISNQVLEYWYVPKLGIILMYEIVLLKMCDLTSCTWDMLGQSWKPQNQVGSSIPLKSLSFVKHWQIQCIQMHILKRNPSSTISTEHFKIWNTCSSRHFTFGNGLPIFSWYPTINNNNNNPDALCKVTPEDWGIPETRWRHWDSGTYFKNAQLTPWVLPYA